MKRSSSADVDLAVIGAGAIGMSIGWRAAAAGLRVLVLERGEPGSGTSHHAAGMLAPVAEVTPGEEPLLALGLRSAGLFGAFVTELAAASPATRSDTRAAARCSSRVTTTRRTRWNVSWRCAPGSVWTWSVCARARRGDWSRRSRRPCGWRLTFPLTTPSIRVRSWQR